MATIIFEQVDGSAIAADVMPGSSLMEGAIRNGVDGIDADCGGMLTCGTCHIRIDDEWQVMLPLPSPAEREILEFTAGCAGDSRLACQIEVRDELDGMLVHIPISRG